MSKNSWYGEKLEFNFIMLDSTCFNISVCSLEVPYWFSV